MSAILHCLLNELHSLQPVNEKKRLKMVIGMETGILNDQSVGFVFKWALYKETFF